MTAETNRAVLLLRQIRKENPDASKDKLAEKFFDLIREDKEGQRALIDFIVDGLKRKLEE